MQIEHLALQYTYVIARDACKCTADRKTFNQWYQEQLRLQDVAARHGIPLDDLTEVSVIEQLFEENPRILTMTVARFLDADHERIFKIRANWMAKRHGHTPPYCLDGDEEKDWLDRYFA